MQVDARTLARAEAKADTGGKVPSTALEVLANIDAMILAVEEATPDEDVQVARIIDIHKALMANAHNPNGAGQIRAEQNWTGGNDYNPCGADFVPPLTRNWVPYLMIFAPSVTRTSSRLLYRQP
jgi:Fic family protein